MELTIELGRSGPNCGFLLLMGGNRSISLEASGAAVPSVEWLALVAILGACLRDSVDKEEYLKGEMTLRVIAAPLCSFETR